MDHKRLIESAYINCVQCQVAIGVCANSPDSHLNLESAQSVDIPSYVCIRSKMSFKILSPNKNTVHPFIERLNSRRIFQSNSIQTWLNMVKSDHVVVLDSWINTELIEGSSVERRSKVPLSRTQPFEPPRSSSRTAKCVWQQWFEVTHHFLIPRF